jgi:hypothetical protein
VDVSAAREIVDTNSYLTLATAGAASFRLYRAHASAHYVLEDDHDERVRVTLSSRDTSPE